MADQADLLDITVEVHLTVRPSEWGNLENGEKIPDNEIADDVAKDVDIAVQRELHDIVTDFAGYEVVLCERKTPIVS